MGLRIPKISLPLKTHVLKRVWHDDIWWQTTEMTLRWIKANQLRNVGSGMLWECERANQSAEKMLEDSPDPLQSPSFTPKCPKCHFGAKPETLRFWGIWRPKSILQHSMQGFRPTMSGPWGWPYFSCLSCWILCTKRLPEPHSCCTRESSLL